MVLDSELDYTKSHGLSKLGSYRHRCASFYESLLHAVPTYRISDATSWLSRSVLVLRLSPLLLTA